VNGAGNGGNVGVCFDSKQIIKDIHANHEQISDDQIAHIVSVTALDLLDARSKYNSTDPDQNLFLSTDTESPQEYVKRISNRFQSVVPALSEIINSEFAALESSDKRYYNSGGIDLVYDVGDSHYLDPKKCVIATAIKQSPKGDSTLLEFDNRLFEHPTHSNQSRNLLFQHETILHWAQTNFRALTINNGIVKDTTGVRNIVSVLIQKQLTFQEVIHAVLNTEYKFGGETYDQFYLAGDYRCHLPYPPESGFLFSTPCKNIAYGLVVLSQGDANSNALAVEQQPGGTVIPPAQNQK